MIWTWDVTEDTGTGPQRLCHRIKLESMSQENISRDNRIGRIYVISYVKMKVVMPRLQAVVFTTLQLLQCHFYCVPWRVSQDDRLFNIHKLKS